MPATTTTDNLLAALDDEPGRTTAELAAATGLGRSTVGKALVALERDGRVRRTPGGRDNGRRRPDHWTRLTDVAPDQPSQSRLRKGQLRALVAEHLQRYPDVEHSPTAIAKSLGRSAGAVNNALDRLAADRVVEQISVTPRRFRIAGQRVTGGTTDRQHAAEQIANT